MKKTLNFFCPHLINRFYTFATRKKILLAGQMCLLSNNYSFYSTALVFKQRLTKDCEWGFGFGTDPFSCKLIDVAQKQVKKKQCNPPPHVKIAQNYAKHPVQQCTCTCLLCFACVHTLVHADFRLVPQPRIFLTCCTNIHIYSYRVTCKSDSTGLTWRSVNCGGTQPHTPPAVT